MRRGIAASVLRCAEAGHSAYEAWERFWFTPADVATLAAIRICTGLLLLYVYGSASPEISSYLGTDAWVDRAAIDQLRRFEPVQGESLTGWWGQSVWFVATTPLAVRATYVAFLAAIVCFTAGLFTRVAAIATLAGHLSFVHRAFLGWSGMDTVLAMLLLYLVLAPSGALWSMDAHLRRRTPPGRSWSANVALRLIQVHMCVIYLSAGLGKLQGRMWWDGTAVWHTIALHEFAPFDVTGLGHLGDTVCLLLSNGGVLLTLGFEIGFAFLVWNAAVRGPLLVIAAVLHAGIGFFMGMAAFGAAMLTGCLAFVDGRHVRGIAARLMDHPLSRRRRRIVLPPQRIRT